MTSEERLIERVNTRLKNLDKSGVKPETVKRVQQELLNFYIEHKIDISKMKGTYISKSKKLNTLERQELLKFARAFDYLETTKTTEAQRVTKAQEEAWVEIRSINEKKWGKFKSEADYILFLKRLNATMDSIKNEELSSKQVARLYTIAKRRGIDESKVDDEIMEALDKGSNKKRRYEYILNQLQTYDNTTKKGD